MVENDCFPVFAKRHSGTAIPNYPTLKPNWPYLHPMLSLIDENFWLHASRIPSKTAGMIANQQPALSYVDSGLDCDTFNIINIQQGDAITLSQLQAAIDHYAGRSYCLWVNQAQLHPAVTQHLAALGLSPQNEEVGMALDLMTWQPIISTKHENIHQVTDSDSLQEYSRVIAANWSPPDPAVMQYYASTADHYLSGQLGATLFTYRQEGDPLATVELFATDAETIGIYGLATLEDARGQGIGSALMTKALNWAKEHGYKRVVLQASADGLGIYQKLGFEEHTVYYEYA